MNLIYTYNFKRAKTTLSLDKYTKLNKYLQLSESMKSKCQVKEFSIEKSKINMENLKKSITKHQDIITMSQDRITNYGKF